MAITDALKPVYRLTTSKTVAASVVSRHGINCLSSCLGAVGSLGVFKRQRFRGLQVVCRCVCVSMRLKTSAQQQRSARVNVVMFLPLALLVLSRCDRSAELKHAVIVALLS